MAKRRVKTSTDTKELLDLIPPYQEFLKAVGFKRIEGAVFGLLVLTPKPLSSNEIADTLGISQGAVSQAIKNLTHWGGVSSQYNHRKRAQLHEATQDSLSIVATIFSKREKGAIANFKIAAERAREQFLLAGEAASSKRILRLNSIVLTCQFAQIIMEFVLYLNSLRLHSHYEALIKALPNALNYSLKGIRLGSQIKKLVFHPRENPQWLQ